SDTQLNRALAYLKQNTKTTGLITLQIGANDLLLNPFIFDPATCRVDDNLFNIGLAVLDNNLKKTILPQLDEARQSSGHTPLVLIGYYNPFQLFCPNTGPFIQTLNSHLQEDILGFGTFVDIYNSFNPTNVCVLTWICKVGDIHPTDAGYQVIAN